MEALGETGDDDLDIKVRHRTNSITNRNLLIAAREGKKDVIDLCISEGANINFVDSDGNSPLHYAVRSKNLEVVKFFVENVEDINVENDDCKTPLDIANALKQYDIIKVLSERNIEQSFEILESQQDQQSDDAVNKLTFMEATFHNDYKIPLSKEDIQNILDFTYFRGDRGNVFKAVETKEDIENEIQIFSLVKKTKTLILNLEKIGWITLVLYYTNEDQFKAYYIDSLGSTIQELPTYIKEPLLSKGIKISDFHLKQHDNMYDSGIFSLKNAEVFNSFSNENEVKEKLQNLELDAKKERELYANLLMEKKRVEDKIAVCLETLKNLNKNKSNVDKLNYKNANVFINFLETFALQDTFPKLSKIWTREEQEQNKKKLTDLKKEYFSTYYFETKNKQDQKSDFSLIRSARKVLHDSKIIQPENFECFMKDRSSVSNFFKKLELYTENIKNKIISKNVGNYHDDVHCYTFLTFEKNIGNQNEGDFLSILRKFLLDIYKPENKIDQEKIIFDVTVNIIPVMKYNKEKVRSLSATRNNLVHNYQEKSILNNEKKFKEIKELHFLRSDLFKYFYSKEVHELLSNILDKNIETLQDEFQKTLEDFQKEIVKEENVSCISGEHSKSFEYIFQESLFPESDENMNNLVDKYLKYAFIVQKKAGAKEVHIDDDEEEEIKCSILTDDKKREIFEDFMKLKKTKNLTRSQIQYERKERNKLKKKLKKYGLEVSYFDRVVKYYLDNTNELPEESIKKRDKIISILSILKQIKKYFSLSNSTIINLYEQFLELKQKGIANLRQCGSILDEELNKIKLTESQKESRKSSILRELCNIPGMETIDIMIGSVKITELNTFDIIRNILSVFCSSYDTYKIKFNNVEEAFNDDIFLDYLVNSNIEQKNDSKILKDKYFVFTIIKKLITMEYTSPYIAKLLIESNNDTVIEKKDFIHLLGTLLKNNAYVKHLKVLLNIESKKFDIYGEFCNKILDNFNIENIRDILQDYNHVNAILNKLDSKLKNIKCNHLMEDEASKVEEFCCKFLDKDFNIENMHNILEYYDDVEVILSKLSTKIENVKVENAFEIHLKLVRELCEKNVIDTKFNDINVQDTFKNNIKEILYHLNAKVRSREVNYQKEKNAKTIEEIIQQILKQLNIIAYELHCNNRYDDVVKILEVSIEANKKLMQNDDLKTILLDAEFKKARSMIQLAIIEKSKCIKDKKKINEALRILHQIENKQERNPIFLLISSEIAYAECLLKKYNKSYKSYKMLFQKIAFNIPNHEFSKLENSKEYQKMLTFSNEAKEYLSITNIQLSMTYNKNCRGWELGRKDKNQGALNNHNEALKILEKLYSFMKTSLKNTSDSENSLVVLDIATKIVYTKLSIGELFVKMKKHKNALQCFQEALVICIQYSNRLRKIYTDFHPKFKQNKNSMAKILRLIASASAEINEFNFKYMPLIPWTDPLDKVRKLKNMQLMCEEAKKINQKLLVIPSYSESEKKRMNNFIKAEENRIGEIEKEIQRKLK